MAIFIDNKEREVIKEAITEKIIQLEYSLEKAKQENDQKNIILYENKLISIHNANKKMIKLISMNISLPKIKGIK